MGFESAEGCVEGEGDDSVGIRSGKSSSNTLRDTLLGGLTGSSLNSSSSFRVSASFPPPTDAPAPAAVTVSEVVEGAASFIGAIAFSGNVLGSRTGFEVAGFEVAGFEVAGFEVGCSATDSAMSSFSQSSSSLSALITPGTRIVAEHFGHASFVPASDEGARKFFWH